LFSILNILKGSFHELGRKLGSHVIVVVIMRSCFSWLRSLRYRVPRVRLAHGALAHVVHDVLFHLLDIPLQVGVLLGMGRLAAAVKDEPCRDDDGGDGDGNGEVDPQLRRDGLTLYVVATGAG
jgi:hypothetical protein